jgi:hypothetical protein
MNKTKSRNKKTKISQGKIPQRGGSRKSRINTFTDALAGVEYYKSKRMDKQKKKKKKH